MEDRYELDQAELGYMYESAQSRMAAHPDFAKGAKRQLRIVPTLSARRTPCKRQSNPQGKGNLTITVKYGPK